MINSVLARQESPLHQSTSSSSLPRSLHTHNSLISIPFFNRTNDDDSPGIYPNDNIINVNKNIMKWILMSVLFFLYFYFTLYYCHYISKGFFFIKNNNKQPAKKGILCLFHAHYNAFFHHISCAHVYFFFVCYM